ncbi:MAG: hypothetical protein M3Q07_01165 [Pseudobdellovibrionaceae bacterium]|nr:hypothetical protein [Pseudobdellovibrionaceae bacterium]
MAKSSGYVCAADTSKTVESPATLQDIAATFESMTTDYSLDNGLLKATFVEDGVTCRYSALILADNAAKTLKLVESLAFASDEASSCSQGKAMLDGYLAANSYLYWGHPHHVTVLIEEPNAAAVCGEGTATVGIDFVLAGKI